MSDDSAEEDNKCELVAERKTLINLKNLSRRNKVGGLDQRNDFMPDNLFKLSRSTYSKIKEKVFLLVSD